MARLPYVKWEQLSEQTQKMFSGNPNGPNNIQLLVAHAEPALKHWVRLGHSLTTQAKFSPRYRELVILRVATLSNCKFEWQIHLSIARKAGLTDEHIEAVRDGGTNPIFTDQEKAILNYTDEVVRNVKASDKAFAAVQSFLDSREIVELNLSIGYWDSVAKCLESLEVDLEPVHKK